jgi:zinc/manganese transport system substrate-binding protein
MKINTTKAFAVIAAALTTVALTGCGTSVTEENETAAESRPSIVTTTNVWSDIVGQVAGEFFDVTAIISDPAQDPHSYDATARDQLAITEADLFVMNGGGYDDFALILASTSNVEVFNVFEILESTDTEHGEEDHADEHGEEDHADEHGEEDHADEHGEEDHADEHGEEDHADEHGEEDHADEHAHASDGSDHIWYDLHLVEQAAISLAEKLGVLQPDNAQDFIDNAGAFVSDISVLEQRVQTLADINVHYFEAHPLATMLFTDLDYENLTPKGLAEAEEAGLESAARVLADSRELIASGKLQFLAINEQVTSPTLEALKSLAEESGVPILKFDELLPDDTNYQEWMGSLLDSIAAVS